MAKWDDYHMPTSKYLALASIQNQKSLIIYLACTCIQNRGANCETSGSGLYPINRRKVLDRITLPSCDQADGPPRATADDPSPSTSENSPRKLLIREITRVISPEVTAEVAGALKNQGRRRKRVQATTGEILTEGESAKRLEEEEQARKSKKGKAVTGKPGLAKSSKGKAKRLPKEKPASKSVDAISNGQQPIQRDIVDSEENTDSEDEVMEVKPRRPRRKLSTAMLAAKDDRHPYKGVVASSIEKILAIEDSGEVEDFERHLGDFEPIEDPGMVKDFQQNCMGSEPDRTD